MANTRIKGKTEITNTAPTGGDQNDKLLDTDLMLLEHNPNGNPDEDRSVKLSELRTYVTAILRQELQNGTLVVKKAECDESGNNIDDRFDDVEDDIDTLNSNDSTTGSVANKIKTAINALDVSSQGGEGKYIQSISETDGKISATAQTMDTSPTANSTKAVTSGGVKTALDAKLNTSLKGANNGLAELGGDGLVLSSQLPSYVDDVLEYSSVSAFPEQGESGKIYVATDTNKTYRWTGSVYTIIASDLALGETSSTAYRGDRGKIAYAHSQATSGNPHNVTKSDVGLGNVDNTSDANKPVSTATQTALDNKVDKVTGKGLSTNDFTNDYKNSLDGGAPVIYCTCSTEGATAIKELTPVNSAYKLQVGSIVAVKFSVSNTVANVQLKLGNVTAFIWYNGGKFTSNWNGQTGLANHVIYYLYNGEYFVWLNNDREDDSKVGQYNSDTDADFRLLLSTNATNNSETNTVKKSGDLTFNPSTKVLKVNNKSVRNADTAIGMQAVDCDTAGDVADKVVDLEGFTLFRGARLIINFKNANTVTGVTLNVNGTGTKTVRVNSSAVTVSNLVVGYYYCIYDGTYWQLESNRDVYYSRYSEVASNTDYSAETANCTTASGNAVKVVGLRSFTTAYNKATFLIRFQNENTYSGKLTLKVNNQTEKDLYINGVITSANNKTLPAGIYMCTWNGTYFNIITDYMYGDTFTASGANAKKGLVPQPPATAGTTKYLREDGTWAVPSGGGSVTVAPHFYVCSTAERFKILSIPEFNPNEDFYFAVLFTANHNGSESDWDLVINNTHYSVYNANGNVLVKLPYYDSSDKYVGIEAGTLLTFYYHEASGRVRLLGSSLMAKGMRFSGDDEELMDLWSDGKCRIYTVYDDYTSLINLPFLNTNYTVSGTNFTITSKTSSALTVAKVASNKPCCVICEGYLW